MAIDESTAKLCHKSNTEHLQLIAGINIGVVYRRSPPPQKEVRERGP